MNLLGFFQIQDFPDKVNFYVMGCISFYKSIWPEIKCNAALFTGMTVNYFVQFKLHDSCSPLIIPDFKSTEIVKYYFIFPFKRSCPSYMKTLFCRRGSLVKGGLLYLHCYFYIKFIFYWHLLFMSQYLIALSPWYSWNIAESGIKHQKFKFKFNSLQLCRLLHRNRPVTWLGLILVMSPFH